MYGYKLKTVMRSGDFSQLNVQSIKWKDCHDSQYKTVLFAAHISHPSR